MLGTSRQSMLSLGSAVFSLSSDLQLVFGAAETTQHVKRQYVADFHKHCTSTFRLS